MAVEKKFEGTPLQVVTTSEMRRELEEIADADKVSLASVIRDCINLSIEQRRQLGEQARGVRA